MGKEGARFEMVHELPCISTEEGGSADIKDGGQGRVVMVKTMIIYVRLSVWPQQHQCKATARVTSSGAQLFSLGVTGWGVWEVLGLRGFGLVCSCGATNKVGEFGWVQDFC